MVFDEMRNRFYSDSRYDLVEALNHMETPSSESWLDRRKTVDLPIRVENSPIIEALVEFRFESGLPRDAVFGVAFSKVREKVGDQVERLPILEIPESIRANDVNLRFQPHYRLKDENHSIMIGPKVISISNYNNYSGWDDFSELIRQFVEGFFEVSVIKKVIRVGVRYINFTNDDIWEKSTLRLTASDLEIPSLQKNLQFTFMADRFGSRVRVSNGVVFNQFEKTYRGSSLDIDTFAEGEWGDSSEVCEIVDQAHTEGKKTFFALVSGEFLKELNPKFE